MRGQCRSYSASIPYLPIIDLLCHACGISASDPATTREEKVNRCLQQVGIDVASTAPYLLHLLGDRIERDWLDEQHLKASTFDILYQMSANGSRQRPLVLEVEDLHWIDATSESWLVDLVERLPNLPIMLIVTYRPGYRPAWIDKSYASQITLPRLSPLHDSQALLTALIGTRSIDTTLQQIWIDKAEGNPFFSGRTRASFGVIS